MWPFKKHTEKTRQQSIQLDQDKATIMDQMDWKQILSEGNVIELVDGCKAKCDGIFGDL